MEKIKILRLTPKRWKEYKKLRLEALQQDPIAFGSSFEEEKNIPEKEWKKRLKTTLFAFSGDKIVGLITYNFRQKKKLKHIADIYSVYVTKKFRKKGVGKELMESAFLHILKNKKIQKISLGVTPEQKAAVGLYKRFGFKVVGSCCSASSLNFLYSLHLLGTNLRIFIFSIQKLL